MVGDFPRITPRTTHLLLCCALVTALLSARSLRAHSGHLYTAYHGTPTIDGDLSDWPTAAWRAIEDRWSWLRTHSGPDDLSARFAVSWDEDHLYLAVEVTDDIHHCPFSGADIYMGDNVQWGVDLDHTEAGSARVAEWGYSLSTLGSGTQESAVWRGTVSTVQHVIVRDEKSSQTRYEAKIALAVELRGSTALGLSILVNENDGADVGFQWREGFWEWSSGIPQPKERHRCGDLFLAPPAQEQGTVRGTLIDQQGRAIARRKVPCRG